MEASDNPRPDPITDRGPHTKCTIWQGHGRYCLSCISVTSFRALGDCMPAWRLAGTLIRYSFSKLQISSQSLHRRYQSVTRSSSVEPKMNGLDSRGKLEGLRMMMKERQLDA